MFNVRAYITGFVRHLFTLLVPTSRNSQIKKTSFIARLMTFHFKHRLIMKKGHRSNKFTENLRKINGTSEARNVSPCVILREC